MSASLRRGSREPRRCIMHTFCCGRHGRHRGEHTRVQHNPSRAQSLPPWPRGGYAPLSADPVQEGAQRGLHEALALRRCARPPAANALALLLRGGCGPAAAAAAAPRLRAWLPRATPCARVPPPRDALRGDTMRAASYDTSAGALACVMWYRVRLYRTIARSSMYS
jgi:hypothetical protein